MCLNRMPCSQRLEFAMRADLATIKHPQEKDTAVLKGIILPALEEAFPKWPNICLTRIAEQLAEYTSKARQQQRQQPAILLAAE